MHEATHEAEHVPHGVIDRLDLTQDKKDDAGNVAEATSYKETQGCHSE